MDEYKGLNTRDIMPKNSDLDKLIFKMQGLTP